MWRYLEEKRTPTSTNIMVVNLFGLLLYCEKMKVNGRPRSFGPARFSLAMTLNKNNKKVLCLCINKNNKKVLCYGHQNVHRLCESHMYSHHVPPRFELRSLDSKSRVPTITPWDLAHDNSRNLPSNIISKYTFL